VNLFARLTQCNHLPQLPPAALLRRIARSAGQVGQDLLPASRWSGPHHRQFSARRGPATRSAAAGRLASLPAGSIEGPAPSGPPSGLEDVRRSLIAALSGLAMVAGVLVGSYPACPGRVVAVLWICCSARPSTPCSTWTIYALISAVGYGSTCWELRCGFICGDLMAVFQRAVFERVKEGATAGNTIVRSIRHRFLPGLQFDSRRPPHQP